MTMTSTRTVSTSNQAGGASTGADAWMRSTVRSADGTEIAWFTRGAGPPLVMVHGGGGDHTRWGPLLPLLEPHVTVHAMDRRGRGASGDHPDYRLEREFEDVAAVVDAVAEAADGPVPVYGHSYGGLCAFGAATLTASIDRLVLYEGWPPVDPAAFAPPPGSLDRIDALLATGEREAALEAVLTEVAGITDEEVRRYREQPSWQARIAAVEAFPREERAFGDHPFDPEVAATIAVPTLLLTGTRSPDWYPEAPTVAAALPDARLIELPGQGHAADIVAPDLIAEALLAFALGDHP
jgi:pimeloyl-ACP methyl ester carboxylesterase